MRRSCAQPVTTAGLRRGISRQLNHSFFGGSHMPAYKVAVYAQAGAQLLVSNRGWLTQVFGSFNRLEARVVHTLHSPYGNYYYVYK